MAWRDARSGFGIRSKAGAGDEPVLWFEKFNGDTILVLCAYNAGESRAQEWSAKFGMRERDVFIERIPFRETRLFVKRNIEHRAAYRRLYPDVVEPLSDKPPNE